MEIIKTICLHPDYHILNDLHHFYNQIKKITKIQSFNDRHSSKKMSASDL